MQTLISPSDLVMRAAGRTPPRGEPAGKSGYCAMCGKPHTENDLVFPFEPEASFTDHNSLSDPTSSVICGSCVGVWSGEFTQTYSKSVICEEGVFPSAKNNHIAYWLLNPPNPPFIMMLSDQKRQHLVWRTPVNYSNKVYQVRFGSKLLTIRLNRLKQAVESCRLLSEAASVGRKGAALKSPFLSMARELDDLKHGRINPNVLKAVRLEEESAQLEKTMTEIELRQLPLRQALEDLNTITPGEMWALTALLYATNPHRPEPVLTP